MITGSQTQIRDYSLDRTVSAGNVNYDPVWMTETSDEELRASAFVPPEPLIIQERYSSEEKATENSAFQNSHNDSDGNESEYLSEEYIHSIYIQCDESIDWGEILAGTSPEELMMDRAFWLECKKYCARIMRGDIDAYLEVIEVFRPVDDILLYAGEFEFGTDASKYIETEFRIEPDVMLKGGVENPLFEDLVMAVSIRVARDLMALLPVKNVVMHVVNNGKTFFSAIADKGEFAKCDFRRETLKDIAGRMQYVSGIEAHGISEVERKTLS